MNPKPTPFGAAPWQQTSWDARAAGNFIGGGAGAGLVVFSVLGGASDPRFTLSMALALALVALGLASVALEIGRPLRALYVFRHARRSWMSREAIVATVLLPVGLPAALGASAAAPLAALLALAYMVCQGRMLHAARGIPAWRDASTPWLIAATALAEGGGLYVVLQAGQVTLPMALLIGATIAARWLLWRAWRARLAARGAAPGALRALDANGRILTWLGSALPLALLATGVPALAAVGGGVAVLAGAWFKHTLITRAGFNQGFALLHLPVRGVPHR